MSLPEELGTARLAHGPSGIFIHGPACTARARAEDTGSKAHAPAAHPVLGACWDQPRPGPSACVWTSGCSLLAPSPRETLRLRSASRGPHTHRAIPCLSWALPACILPCPPLSSARFTSPRAGAGMWALCGPPLLTSLACCKDQSQTPGGTGPTQKGHSGASGHHFC